MSVFGKKTPQKSKGKEVETGKFELETASRPVLYVEVLQGRRLGKKDALAQVTLGELEVKTASFKQSDAPQWNQKFIFDVTSDNLTLYVAVIVKKVVLGQVTVPLSKLKDEKVLYKWNPVVGGQGDILLKVQYCHSDTGKMHLLKETLTINYYDELEEILGGVNPKLFPIIFDHAKCVPSKREGKGNFIFF
jgi:hypothetical protein